MQLAERLAETDPAKYRRLLVAALNSLGDLERRVGDTSAARTHLQRALQFSEALAAEDPENTEPQLEISFCLRTLGEVEELAGDRERARGHLKRAQELAAAQVRRSPASIDARRELSHVLTYLGTMEVAAGEFLARLVDVKAQTDPLDTDAQHTLGVALRKSGAANQKIDDLRAARVDDDRSLSILDALRHEHPDDGDIAFAVVEVRLQLADLAGLQGDASERRLHLAAAKEVLDGMDARGQLAGVVQREQARDLVRRALGRTRPSGPRPR